MNSSAQFLSPSEAARRLGVSTKALRLYEQRGLVSPIRTAAGWRVYGPGEMARAAEIAALRALGLSLAQVARVLAGASEDLEPALAAHQAMLETRIRQLAGTVEKVRGLRSDLDRGRTPAAGELTGLLEPDAGLSVTFELPWPWGGERFELSDIRAINYIIGPLGSGKTRLAKRLAETLPGAAFLGLERSADGGAKAQARLDADSRLKSRVERALAWLVEDGAAASTALTALLVELEAEAPAILVVDMVEQGLDQATQEALIAYLRGRGSRAFSSEAGTASRQEKPSAFPRFHETQNCSGGRALFLLTRSSAILDLAAVGSDEAILFCPANHNPPVRVAPYPGAPGYETVATCLASPEVRARTEGVIAWRPQVA